MQQDTLRFILKVMETGQYLSRKTIVMYVLQQLQNDYRQASKTSVGHVVQLLYRASCFNVSVCVCVCEQMYAMCVFVYMCVCMVNVVCDGVCGVCMCTSLNAQSGHTGREAR